MNPFKSRDILDPIYLPIKKSVDIQAILYSSSNRNLSRATIGLIAIVWYLGSRFSVEKCRDRSLQSQLFGCSCLYELC